MAVHSTVELWTLYFLAVISTALRAYSRLIAVGLRRLQLDDYLIWLAIFIYTAQCALGHAFGEMGHNVANNGMTDVQRRELAKDDPEFGWRVVGSQIQVAGWTTATCLLWSLKICMAIFYLRLTEGLGKYRKRIHVAMFFVVVTFVTVVMTIYLSCRPFHHYWQLYPDPGNQCQAAISKPILLVSFISNVSTEMFLVMIPIPLLWRSSLRLVKKIAATSVLCAGVLIIICATLKSVHIIVDPTNGGQAAAAWGTRETFIAVVTTNLPMIFPLLRMWFAPMVPHSLRSSSNKVSKSPRAGFVTIGGRNGVPGGALDGLQCDPQSVHHITEAMTLDNGSEECIINKHCVRMVALHDSGPETSRSANAIFVSKEISITSETRQ